MVAQATLSNIDVTTPATDEKRLNLKNILSSAAKVKAEAENLSKEK